MNEREQRDMIDGYLRRLEREMAEVPVRERRELIEDVRSHIEESWQSAPDQSQAALLNVLDRLGSPEDLASEERERLGIAAAPERRSPGLLEIAAIVLTAFFWPVGVLLAWLSARWHTPDKLVATAIPALGFALLLASSLVATTTFVSGPVVTSTRAIEVNEASQTTSPGGEVRSQVDPATGIAHEAPREPWWQTARALFARVIVLFGLLGAPFTSALYLALRMRPAPRRAALLLPAAAGLLVVFAVISAFLAPMAA